MAKKTQKPFLRKDAMKTAGPKALNTVIRGSSAIAANAVSNMASNVVPKAHGPILSLIGLAGDIFIENEQARAVTEGLGVMGFYKTAQEFIPQGALREKLALGATDDSNDSDEEITVDSSVDWDALAEEAEIVDDQEEEEGIEGIDEEMDETIQEFNQAEEELKTLNESII